MKISRVLVVILGGFLTLFSVPNIAFATVMPGIGDYALVMFIFTVPSGIIISSVVTLIVYLARRKTYSSYLSLWLKIAIPIVLSPILIVILFYVLNMLGV